MNKLESQNTIMLTSLGTIERASLGTKRVIVIWEQSQQCPLGTNVPASLRNNRASIIWEQSCQFHLRPIAAA